MKRSERGIRDGDEALAAGRWPEARRAFEIALKEQETPQALEGLAMAAWWLDDAPAVFDARERAYRLYRQRGDSRAAARVAVALAEDSLYFRGEPAVARGWHRRAGRLLQHGDPTPEHAWLKVSESDFALSVDHDPAAAGVRASEAASIRARPRSDRRRDGRAFPRRAGARL